MTSQEASKVFGVDEVLALPTLLCCRSLFTLPHYESQESSHRHI